jgi:hypothetical protein
MNIEVPIVISSAEDKIGIDAVRELILEFAEFQT